MRPQVEQIVARAGSTIDALGVHTSAHASDDFDAGVDATIEQLART